MWAPAMGDKHPSTSSAKRGRGPLFGPSGSKARPDYRSSAGPACREAVGYNPPLLLAGDELRQISRVRIPALGGGGEHEGGNSSPIASSRAPWAALWPPAPAARVEGAAGPLRASRRTHDPAR